MVADPIWMCVVGEMASAGVPDDVIDDVTKAYERLREAHPTEPPERIAARLEHLLRSRRGVSVQKAARQIDARARIDEFVQGQETPEARLRSMLSILSRDAKGRYNYGQNYEAVRHTVQSGLHARLASFIQKNSPRWFHAVQNRAEQDAIGEAYFGARGQNAEADAMADAVRSVFKDVLHRLRSYGLRIGEVENFMPAFHNPSLIRGVEFDEWKAFVLERTNAAQKINRDTGAVFTPEELDDVLLQVHEKITKGDGDVFRSFGDTSHTKWTDRLERDRFFEWNDYRGWKEYSERFGNGGNLIETMASYINLSARDLAILHTMGLDPQATLRELKEQINTIVKEHPDLRDVGRKVDQGLDHQWLVVSGDAARPVSESMAAVEEAHTTLVRLAALGGSGLASLNDIVMSGSASHYFGLANQFGLVDFVRGFSDVYRRDKSERMTRLLKAGFGGDTFLSGVVGNSRAMGEFVGPRVLHRVNDAFFRANQTVPITEGIRNANASAALIGLSDVVSGGLGNAPKRLADALRSYGVTDELLARVDQPEYRVELSEGTGLNIPAIARDFGLEAAAPFTAVVDDIRFMSSPAPTVAVRAYLNRGQQPGNGLIGMLWRSFTMFWQFPMTAFQTQILRRVHNTTDGPMSKGAQIATLMVAGTLAGAGIVQARQILSGREPMEWDESRLWTSAALMSGVFGVWGDYVARDVGMWNSPKALTGPTVGNLVDVATAAGAAASALHGEDVNPGSAIARAVKGVTPGQNAPLVGVAINRLMLEQLRSMIDPNAQKAYRRSRRELRRRTGQREWWRTGEALPRMLQ